MMGIKLIKPKEHDLVCGCIKRGEVDGGVRRTVSGEEAIVCISCLKESYYGPLFDLVRTKVMELDLNGEAKLLPYSGGNVTYTYTGSLFNKPDFVIKCDKNDKVTASILIDISTRCAELGYVPPTMSVKDVAIEGQSIGGLMVKVVKVSYQAQIDLALLNKFGEVDRVELYRILLPDANYKYPGEDGYEDTLGQLSDDSDYLVI